MKWTPKRLFQGRLKRIHFLVGNLVINGVMTAFLMYYFGGLRFNLYPVFWALFSISVFMIFSLIIRRLHDIGKSGKWSAIFLIPGVNAVFLIALFFIPGVDDKNNYEKYSRGVIKSIFNIK